MNMYKYAQNLRTRAGLERALGGHVADQRERQARLRLQRRRWPWQIPVHVQQRWVERHLELLVGLLVHLKPSGHGRRVAIRTFSAACLIPGTVRCATGAPRGSRPRLAHILLSREAGSASGGSWRAATRSSPRIAHVFFSPHNLRHPRTAIDGT